MEIHEITKGNRTRLPRRNPDEILEVNHNGICERILGGISEESVICPVETFENIACF